MGYTKVDNSLIEQGVAVDILNDGSLFVKLRASRAKAVEQERQKQQAPYRNILLAGRQLPAGVSRRIGQLITANAVVVGIAGTLPDGSTHGRIETPEGGEPRPVEFATVEPELLIRNFDEFPDFEEDVSAAAQTNATFAAVAVDAKGDIAPGTREATEEAAKN
jgi:hypothetical protein